MFADLGHPIPDSTRVLSPPLERATKHGYTPYTYSTRWINHPDSDTNLAARPDAMIPISQTNWADEMISEEHRQTGNHMESIYDALRHNDRKFHDYVGRVDAAIKTGRELNWKDIRAQREAHWKALEARQRLEKIKSYD
jgi:hypothetical protein